MNVLVGCEFSGIVRKAFTDKGHYAFSCDLEPCEMAMGYHMQMDIFTAIAKGRWDLIILHPPCTHLAVSGNRWYANTLDRQQSITWTLHLWEAAIKAAPKVALENPVGVLSSAWRKPDQYIQPWMFGHGETKATCLWIKGLPNLVPTDIVEGREQAIWKMSPSKDRTKLRSKTYKGVADAMVEQWGKLL